MRTQGKAFTLIELLVVISIIGLLIAVFVPQIPAILNYYRIHVSKSVMHQLEMGVDQYARIYGAYPWDLARMHVDGIKMLNGETDPQRLPGKGWTSPEVCHYGNSQGYSSLFLMLQGPNGTGWGPTAAFPKVKEFGPFFESPGFVFRPTDGKAPYFVDPFGRPICYYKAILDSTYEHISLDRISYPNRQCKYSYLSDGFESGVWTAQRGANEFPCYPVDARMTQTMAMLHWEARLTRSIDSNGWRYPYNPKTYILWLAGGDERFGYWTWSDEHGGFILDEEPEDNGQNDHVIGRCDDILSSGER